MRGRKSKGKSSSSGNVRDGAQPFRTEFGERLLWLLDEFDHRSQAAEIVGVTPEHLPSYVNGSVKPRFEAMARLAAAKNVSLSWLATGQEPRRLSDAEPDGFVAVALQKDADTRFDEGDNAPLLFARTWLRKLTTAPDDALCVVIHRGNANEPVIQDGDTLLVDTTMQQLTDDSLFVFSREGKFQARFVEELVNGRIALKAHNRRHNVETLTPEEVSQLQVLGRVCWRGGLI